MGNFSLSDERASNLKKFLEALFACEQDDEGEGSEDEDEEKEEEESERKIEKEIEKERDETILYGEGDDSIDLSKVIWSNKQAGDQVQSEDSQTDREVLPQEFLDELGGLTHGEGQILFYGS